jgi:chromosome segregation ATPase
MRNIPIVLGLFLLLCGARLIAAEPPAEGDAGKTDAKKAAAITALDRTIVTAKSRIATLQKQQDKIEGKLTIVHAAQEKFKAIKTTMDDAMAHVEATAKIMTRTDGTSYKVNDPAAERAAEDAQRAYNRAKNDYGATDEQAAQIEAQQQSVQKQLDKANERLQELEDKKQKLIDGDEATEK